MKASTSVTWAFWASLAIAGATAPAAGCSSSSSSGDGGTGSDDAEAETGASSSSGGGTTDAPEDQNAVDDGSSSGSSSSSSGSGGADSSSSSGGDAAPDNSSCDLANTCTGATCCPRAGGSCPPFTLTATTVSDSSTGLTWERNFDTVADYSGSVTACATWGGRLPTEIRAHELPCVPGELHGAGHRLGDPGVERVHLVVDRVRRRRRAPVRLPLQRADDDRPGRRRPLRAVREMSAGGRIGIASGSAGSARGLPLVGEE